MAINEADILRYYSTSPQHLPNLPGLLRLILKPFPPFPHTQHVRIVDITGPRSSPGTKQQESFQTDFLHTDYRPDQLALLAIECLPDAGRHF